MFWLIDKEYDAIMDQYIYTYQNEDKVAVKIWVDNEKKQYLDSKIFGVHVSDPLGAIYGMSLNFSLDQFFLCVDRPIEYPLDQIEAVDKSLWRQKSIADEINTILEKYR